MIHHRVLDSKFSQSDKNEILIKISICEHIQSSFEMKKMVHVNYAKTNGPPVLVLDNPFHSVTIQYEKIMSRFIVLQNNFHWVRQKFMKKAFMWLCRMAPITQITNGIANGRENKKQRQIKNAVLTSLN